MRLSMKEPVELEPLKKLYEIRRFSNKELTLLKSSEYCGPIGKKSYHYLSGIVGMAYNPFINEDVPDCFFDYKEAVLLRFCWSRISTIRCIASQHVKLGLVLEERVTAPSIPKSDRQVKF